MVTVCLVPFENKKQFFKTLNRVREAEGDFKITVINNSVEDYIVHPPITYRHHKNKNQLAGATNIAIKLCETKYFVYVCTNDVYFYSNDWLSSMVLEMEARPKIAMGGTVLPYKDKPHVQGGLFIARTDIMKNNLYKYDYPFRFMDVYMSRRLMEAGYKLGTIKSIYSIYKSKKIKSWTAENHKRNIKNKRYKAVHGHGLENF